MEEKRKKNDDEGNMKETKIMKEYVTNLTTKTRK